MEPVHPAGQGTAPDFMARTLAQLVPDWSVATTASGWIAGGNDACVRVDVDPRRWRTARWTVTGQRGDPATADRELPEVTFTFPWDDFRAAEADRVVAALRAFGVLPEPAGEFQWGVRTTYADGSQGIDWANEDEARDFLAHYAEYDAEPHMQHFRTRELVRRPIAAGEIEVAESDYGTRRRAADERVKNRHPA